MDLCYVKVKIEGSFKEVDIMMIDKIAEQEERLLVTLNYLRF